MKYINLGLPSGTLWAETNENGFYTFDEAVEKYGDSLPTREQWEELKDHCRWEWIGDGYRVKGANSNSIVLPSEGYRDCKGLVNYVRFCGYYWSSTSDGSDFAWELYFHSNIVSMGYNNRYGGKSVRLVKRNER